MAVATPGSDSSMEREPDFGGRIHHVGTAGNRPALAVSTGQGTNRCVLRLSGRLGSDTVRLLDRHVDLLGSRSCEEVVVDLAGLELMDQVGARVIVGLGHYVAARGGRFEVTGAAGPVATMLARAEIELAS